MSNMGGMDMANMSGMWHKPMQPKVWISYYDVAEFNSGPGGSASGRLYIPEELYGAYKINILIISDNQYPYMAYNWFYNNTTTMDHCAP